jgi:long-chain acyl-CoA synthetase
VNAHSAGRTGMDVRISGAEATASTLVDGWLHTGDIGSMHERGYLHPLDRCKDLIITGGSNVHPIEIDCVLDAHPDTHESAGIGVPDHACGAIVTAVLVRQTGANASPQAVREHCLSSLAPHTSPRVFHVRPEIPRNADGKVSKATLRAQLADS